MFGPVNAVCTLASRAFDALARITYPAADEMWDAATRRQRDDEEQLGPSSEVTYLDEIAGHLAAQTPLLEDIRNLLNHIVSAAPGSSQPQQPAAAAERPARGEPRSRTSRAGHPDPLGNVNATSKALRVAANGLRDWAAGEPCGSANYFAHIAETVDGIAQAREQIESL